MATLDDLVKKLDELISVLNNTWNHNELNTIEQLVLRADKEKLIREFGLEKVQQWENEINSTKI